MIINLYITIANRSVKNCGMIDLRHRYTSSLKITSFTALIKHVRHAHNRLTYEKCFSTKDAAIKMGRKFNLKKKITKTKQRRAQNRKARNLRKTQNQITKAKTLVKNFSDYALTDDECLVLSKGLKFIPSPKPNKIKQQILNDFKEFERKLRCRVLFNNNKHDHNIHPFYTKSYYDPGFSNNPVIESYLFATKMALSKMQLSPFRDNISMNERLALETLRNNKNIVIKKADKSTTIVIQNKSNYVSEGLRQLNDRVHYQHIPHHNTENIEKEIYNCLHQLRSLNEIDDTTYTFLRSNKKPKTGNLYLLPKIHKLGTEKMENYIGVRALENQNLIKARPIIAQCASPTMTIGRFIDYFLVPLVQKQETHIRDTSDFVSKIEKIQIKKEYKLVTYDVTSMYTNMVPDELISAVNRALTKNKNVIYDIKTPSVDNLTNLLSILINNNEFEFEGKYYIQTLGCSMGAVPSPEISDLRMYEILNSIISKFNRSDKIITHLRFRDDGFMIFDATVEEIKEFFNIANNEHDHIKFTFDISENEAIFLDTKVSKSDRFKQFKILDIETYIKPTETFMYLHRTSAHPEHTFKAFIKGELIRNMRNTSNEDKRKKIIFKFMNRLIGRGYSKLEIQKVLHETENLNRNELLKTRTDRQNTTPLVFVTKYNPRVRKLGKIIRTHWPKIAGDAHCSKLFENPPVIGYKRHKNVAELLK